VVGASWEVNKREGREAQSKKIKSGKGKYTQNESGICVAVGAHSTEEQES